MEWGSRLARGRGVGHRAEGPRLERLRVDTLTTRGLGPVSFTLAPGECAFLSGPSGAGKTLLLRAIADLDPHEGDVYLDGVPQARFAPTEWRRRVGMLPAESRWWDDLVGPHFREPDEAGLASLGFSPEVLGWSVVRLSSGEKQRLALLRLLANRPRVLLLDEPTANLDPASAARVEALLDDYRHARGASLLWVSHDPAQIERVGGQRYRFADGRLTRAGGR